MLTVGDRFPAFQLQGVVSNDVADRDAHLYGVSTDSEFVHLA